jgi:glycosyltransferase involved in cell wall biosynthesis
MATVEAAACGTATVGTAVGILPEMDMPTAPPGDAAGLAASVLGVLQAPGTSRELGERAREWVQAKLTLERCVERLVRLYSLPGGELPGDGTPGSASAR